MEMVKRRKDDDDDDERARKVEGKMMVMLIWV